MCNILEPVSTNVRIFGFPIQPLTAKFAKSIHAMRHKSGIIWNESPEKFHQTYHSISPHKTRSFDRFSSNVTFSTYSYCIGIICNNKRFVRQDTPPQATRAAPPAGRAYSCSRRKLPRQVLTRTNRHALYQLMSQRINARLSSAAFGYRRLKNKTHRKKVHETYVDLNTQQRRINDRMHHASVFRSKAAQPCREGSQVQVCGWQLIYFMI